MFFAFEFVRALQPEELPLFAWTLGVGGVIAALLLYLRDRFCKARGHNFEELDCFPGGKDTMVVSYKCRRCGFKKYEEKKRAA